MKWRCSYLQSEKEEAVADLTALLQRHPGARVHESRANPPYTVVYLTVKEPKKNRLPRDFDH